MFVNCAKAAKGLLPATAAGSLASLGCWSFDLAVCRLRWLHLSFSIKAQGLGPSAEGCLDSCPNEDCEEGSLKNTASETRAGTTSEYNFRL